MRSRAHHKFHNIWKCKVKPTSLSSRKSCLSIKNRTNVFSTASRPVKLYSLSFFPVKTAKTRLIRRVIQMYIFGFARLLSVRSDVVSRLWTVRTTDNHHAFIPFDFMCCFYWASKGDSKHVCVSMHIVFQIDRCRWNTDLLKLNKVLSLKAARVASCN